jgi:hypothetical protein
VSAIPKRATPKRETPAADARDHEHVSRISTQITLGAAARLHPVLVIFCFLSGALLFGVVEVIMAVPIALVVKVTLAPLYDEPTEHALASQ